MATKTKGRKTKKRDKSKIKKSPIKKTKDKVKQKIKKQDIKKIQEKPNKEEIQEKSLSEKIQEKKQDESKISEEKMIKIFLGLIIGFSFIFAAFSLLQSGQRIIDEPNGLNGINQTDPSIGINQTDPSINGNDVESKITAQLSDTVYVWYAGYFENKTVFDTNIEEIAIEHDLLRFTFNPLSFKIGDKNMIPGFEQAVIGMKIGEKKTVTLSPEQAYGPKQEELIFDFPKQIEIEKYNYLDRFYSISKQDFLMYFSDELEIGGIYPIPDMDFNFLVLNIQDEIVNLTLSLEIGDKFTPPYNPWEVEVIEIAQDYIKFEELAKEGIDYYDEYGLFRVKIEEETIILYRTYEIGDEIEIGYDMYGVVTEIYEDYVKIDANHELAGKTIIFDIIIEDIIKRQKHEVPKVELFVMTHCPYGIQMAKGILPVAYLLEDKIDFQLKYVSYSMSGEKEVLEQLNQYCIQKEQNERFLLYLECFFGTGNGQECLDFAKIDMQKLQNCIQVTDEKYEIIKLLRESPSVYPPFNIHLEENIKYEVRGSPTLVIAEEKIEGAQRNPQALLNLICSYFIEEPDECNKILDSNTPSPAFGWDSSSFVSSDATCG